MEHEDNHTLHPRQMKLVTTSFHALSGQCDTFGGKCGLPSFAYIMSQMPMMFSTALIDRGERVFPPHPPPPLCDVILKGMFG